MKRSRIFWIVAAAGIFLAVLAALGTTAWIGRFLRGEAFRKLIAAKTGEALDAQAVYGPLRWTGSSLFVDSIEVTGLPGSIAERLRADQVRADLNLRAIIHGAWRVDQIHVASFDGTLRPGSNEPRVSGAPPPAVVHGIEAWLPMRFELGELDIARARVRFRGIEGLEIAFLQDSALHVHPDGAGWAIEGSGGLLVLPKVPGPDRRKFPFQGTRRCIVPHRLAISAWRVWKNFRFGRIRQRFEAPHRMEPDQCDAVP